MPPPEMLVFLKIPERQDPTREKTQKTDFNLYCLNSVSAADNFVTFVEFIM